MGWFENRARALILGAVNPSSEDNEEENGVSSLSVIHTWGLFQHSAWLMRKQMPPKTGSREHLLAVICQVSASAGIIKSPNPKLAGYSLVNGFRTALFSTGEAFRRSIVSILIPLAFKYELISTSVEQIIEIVHLAQDRKLAYFEISHSY